MRNRRNKRELFPKIFRESREVSIINVSADLGRSSHIRMASSFGRTVLHAQFHVHGHSQNLGNDAEDELPGREICRTGWQTWQMAEIQYKPSRQLVQRIRIFLQVILRFRTEAGGACSPTAKKRAGSGAFWLEILSFMPGIP